MGKKVLMLGNSSLVIFGFRGELISELVKAGYEVTVSFPNGPFGDGEKISKKYNCSFIETPINRHGTNIFQDLVLIQKYKDIMSKLKPDIVLSYTIKCNIYGGIVCNKLGIHFIPNITGLGNALTNTGFVGKITILLYRKAMEAASCVFFQNKSDRKFFVDNNIKFRESKILPGSGVDLNKYKPLVYPSDDKVVFMYVGRVMHSKGIDQYINAAESIRKSYPKAEFHICGYCEENYKDILQREENKGTIVYHGLVNNIIDYEVISQCVILPSFYPEGVSNVLLEAAASARPIITTNRPGCKETVDNNISGFLVKEKSSNDLVDKIQKFLNLSNNQKKQMGINGRMKMEKSFSREIVVNTYMNEVRSALD